MTEKEAAQLVQLNYNRMRRLGRQYLCNGGSFKKTREQKKEAQYPVEMLAHVLAPETLQWQGGRLFLSAVRTSSSGKAPH